MIIGTSCGWLTVCVCFYVIVLSMQECLYAPLLQLFILSLVIMAVHKLAAA